MEIRRWKAAFLPGKFLGGHCVTPRDSVDTAGSLGAGVLLDAPSVPKRARQVRKAARDKRSILYLKTRQTAWRDFPVWNRRRLHWQSRSAPELSGFFCTNEMEREAQTGIVSCIALACRHGAVRRTPNTTTPRPQRKIYTLFR